ncbi:MAG: ATP-binding protein [archaeon]
MALSVSINKTETHGIEEIIIESESGKYSCGQIDPKKKGTILYAENDNTYRDLIADYLRDCGYNVLTVRNASESIAVIRGIGGMKAINLLLSDIIMEDTAGGIEFLRTMPFSSFPNLSMQDSNGFLTVAYLMQAPPLNIPKIMLTSSVTAQAYYEFASQFLSINMMAFPKSANSGFLEGLFTQIDYMIKKSENDAQEELLRVEQIRTGLFDSRLKETYAISTELGTALSTIGVVFEQLNAAYIENRPKFSNQTELDELFRKAAERILSFNTGAVLDRNYYHGLANNLTALRMTVSDLANHSSQFAEAFSGTPYYITWESSPLESLNAQIESAHRSIRYLNNPLSQFGTEKTISTCCYELDSRVKTRLADKNITLKIDYSSDDLRKIVVTSAVEEALVEIVKNAIDASSDGSEITLSVFSDGTDYGFRVLDCGHGISPSDQAKIWLSGYTTKPLHLGSGLAYVKDLSSEFGFSASLERSDTTGSSFLIKYPMYGQYNLPDKPIKKMCLLIVDDDKIYLKRAEKRPKYFVPDGVELEIITARGYEEAKTVFNAARLSQTNADYFLALVDLHLYGNTEETEACQQTVKHLESLGLPRDNGICLYSGTPIRLEWNTKYPMLNRLKIFDIDGIIVSMIKEHNARYA